MRQDYPEGLRIKTLEKGVPGQIIRPEKLSIGVFHYWVKLDDEKAPKLMHYNMIAPADHPWHQKMIEWRAEGLRRGFTWIVIGTTKTGYRVFYCKNGPAGHNDLMRRYPHINMTYFWEL